jgi:hypothetical protein
MHCSWLQQQPVFINMQLLLRGLAKPSLMNVQVAAVLSPLLRLRVLQLKLWKVRLCCVSIHEVGCCDDHAAASSPWISMGSMSLTSCTLICVFFES